MYKENVLLGCRLSDNFRDIGAGYHTPEGILMAYGQIKINLNLRIKLDTRYICQ